jgi:hypothetical protein
VLHHLIDAACLGIDLSSCSVRQQALAEFDTFGVKPTQRLAA